MYVQVNLNHLMKRSKTKYYIKNRIGDKHFYNVRVLSTNCKTGIKVFTVYFMNYR